MFEHIGKKHLGILRATVFGLWFFIVLFSPITSYSYLPVEIFNPLGIYRAMFWLTGEALIEPLLSYESLFFLKSALLAGTLGCAIGMKPFKAFAIPTVCLLLFLDMITKGFNGYVNHAELVLLYSSIVIIFFPAANVGALARRDSNTSGEVNQYQNVIPLVLVGLILCLSYSFVGLNRIIFGGFEQFYNNALNIHLITNSLNYTKYGLDWGLIVANSTSLLVLFKFGFLMITIFEILSPLILFLRKFRLVWLAVIIPFHILSLLTMKIFFWENTILILVLFLVIGELMKEKKQKNQANTSIFAWSGVEN